MRATIVGQLLCFQKKISQGKRADKIAAKIFPYQEISLSREFGSSPYSTVEDLFRFDVPSHDTFYHMIPPECDIKDGHTTLYMKIYLGKNGEQVFLKHKELP